MKEDKKTKKKRIKQGQGKVEYLAHKEKIFSLLAKGYTITAIHEQLTKEGKITLSYPRFAALLPKKSKELPPEKERKTRSKSPKTSPKADSKAVKDEEKTPNTSEQENTKKTKIIKSNITFIQSDPINWEDL